MVYLLAVFVVGLPALLAEFVVGRRANTSAIGAFGALGRKRWWFVGALGVIAAFWTLSYYSVIGGWVIRSIAGSVTGSALAPVWLWGLRTLVLVVVVAVVLLNLQDLFLTPEAGDYSVIPGPLR